MDEPILYNPYTKKDFSNVDNFTLVQRLCIALSNDDKTAFLSHIKDPGFGKLRGSCTAEAIFNFDPLEIAKSLLNGETPDIDTEDVWKDGMTPLHLAVICDAPRLTRYFLENGGKVDAVCYNKKFKLKQATPIGCCTDLKKPSKTHTLFNLIWWLCFHERARIEIIRLFVQSEQHRWARQEFINCAQNGEMRKLAALFLAAPELCFPCLSMLNDELKNSELNAHIKNQLSLLFDVFTVVGDKLAAYIRLEEFTPKSCTVEEIERTMLEVESFIREAFIKKHGDHYVDYYLRFFEADKQKFNDDGKQNSDYYMDSAEEWDRLTSWLKGNAIYNLLPYMLQRTGFKRSEIHRLIPTLESQNPVRADILRADILARPIKLPAVLDRMEVEEPVADNEVNVAAKKPAGEEENVDAEKEATVNKAEEDPEEKQEYYNVIVQQEEYEMILLEEKRKRKAWLFLSEQKKGEERKFDVKEFQSMQLESREIEEDISQYVEKANRIFAAEREKEFKKSVSTNEFLKPFEGEILNIPGGCERGRARSYKDVLIERGRARSFKDVLIERGRARSFKDVLIGSVTTHL